MTARDLTKIANQLRSDTLEMVYRAGAGHIAGPLSSAELLVILYFGDVANLEPFTPGVKGAHLPAQAGTPGVLWDRVVLSCGHYCPILYSALARSGHFPVGELESFMQLGSRLPGHPERGSVPGIEISSGPLGQGVSVATGMALAMKMRYGYMAQEQTPKVFCIISDGEIQEGQVWEAFNFGVRRQLDNLIFLLDRNKVQIENYVSQVATYTELAGRFEAFGLHTLEVDGHDIAKLKETIERAKKVMGGPAMVIANTVAGKGVSFMENKPEWHDKVPTKQELQAALEELGVKDANNQ